jgi:hypothetical protein
MIVRLHRINTQHTHSNDDNGVRDRDTEIIDLIEAYEAVVLLCRDHGGWIPEVAMVRWKNFDWDGRSKRGGRG